MAHDIFSLINKFKTSLNLLIFKVYIQLHLSKACYFFFDEKVAKKSRLNRMSSGGLLFDGPKSRQKVLAN